MELEVTPDAGVAEKAAGMIEKEEQNALLRTPVMTGLQANHARSLPTDRALPSQFREGDLLPHRGERAIHALKGQLEFVGEAGLERAPGDAASQQRCGMSQGISQGISPGGSLRITRRKTFSAHQVPINHQLCPDSPRTSGDGAVRAREGRVHWSAPPEARAVRV